MRIVCLGDSLTSGYSQGEDKYPYGAILQKLLDKEVGKGKHEVITCGNNGETAVSMAKRYAVTTEIAERRRLPPKLFIIMAGTNDLLAYPVIEEEKIVNAISAMVDQTAVESGGRCGLHGAAHAGPRGAVPGIRADEAALPPERAHRREVRRGPRRRHVVPRRLRGGWFHLTKKGYAELAKLVYPVCRAAMKRCRPSKKTRPPKTAPAPKRPSHAERRRRPRKLRQRQTPRPPRRAASGKRVRQTSAKL